MNRKAGYSLVEVLIAFAIMTLVLSALIPGQAQLLGRAVAQEDKVLAHDYALSQVAAMGITTSLDPASNSYEYRDWRVNTNITQGAVIRENTNTVRIIVTINNRDGQRLASVDTLKVVP